MRRVQQKTLSLVSVTVVRLAALLLAASTGACIQWAPYSGQRELAVPGDADTLYGAAIRVFVRKGWGFQSRDPIARTIETVWIRYDGMGEIRLSHRLIVDRGKVRIFTSCLRGGLGGQKCRDDERPLGTPRIETDLVAEIVAETKTMDAPTPAADERPRRGDVGACVGTCGKDRQSCQIGCGRSDACKEACVGGYVACVKACGQ